jgi:anion-transporting  ArsA/GET3 family ATPase
VILNRVLDGRQVVVCAGAGGVGKTTVAAALGSELAARGGRVLVLTIDPARRLAGALGLPEHGDDAHEVDLRGNGVEIEGSLHAAMLDAQLTFDRLVREEAPSERGAERIIENPIYRQVSSAVAGAHEYMAMERLYELYAGGRYDVIVLDTPPSRNALDFLEAPGRLTRFVEGRALRYLLKPGMRAGRLGFSMVERIAGVTFLRDLSELAAGFEGMYDGFARRAADVSALLASERTTFLLVTVPQTEPLAEADFFWRALRERELPFGGMIVNKVHPTYVGGAPAARTRLRAKAKRALRDAGVPDPAAGRAAQNLVHYQALADRDRENIEALERRIGTGPIVEVPLLDHDVHDLEGVTAVARHLFAQPDGLGA